MKVTGSLRDKRGIWQMVVRVQTDDSPPIQKSKSTQIRVAGKNQKESRSNQLSAEKMLAVWISELETQHATGASRMLIQALEEWLSRKKRSIRTDTYEGYQSYYDKHIKPFFSPINLTLSEVTPRLIQRYVDKKEEEGLAAGSIEKHLVVLNGVFKEAIKLQEITSNPCSTVTLSRKKKFKGKAYDAATARKLLAEIRGSPLETPVYLGLYLGLRRSEACGLRWQDIDFEQNTVTIRNTIIQFKSIYEQEETKSDASNRTLYLPAGLKSYLLGQKEKADLMRILCGKDYTDGTHVCQWPDGRAYRPDYITQQFRRFLEKSGLPVIRFHDLRHTAGSLLINEGHSAKQVQEFLGHEKVSTTLDIYTHLSVEGKADTASCLDNLLTIQEADEKRLSNPDKMISDGKAAKKRPQPTEADCGP